MVWAGHILDWALFGLVWGMVWTVLRMCWYLDGLGWPGLGMRCDGKGLVWALCWIWAGLFMVLGGHVL
jgi:hypothetical protein